ncbi:SanA protein [Ekhidna lutea]|uniref:SanA protein n=1 Tax=Ekhidna lutea TaxID=447679 RepID=A0A239GPM6_EKHLU|nr:ElyC/SanA/YdcF family protein [Ekhidna lutea]SNS71090.1 SanA protein [Ekhidna lutea]
MIKITAKKLIRLGFWIAITLFLFVLVTNIWVVQSTKDLIYDPLLVPSNEVALVLGTSKRTTEGKPNRFFVERMDAAALLHADEKVKHILVSGDNRTKYYNEPRDMLQALGDLNIPEEDISLDFAGLRTLDSVVRCREVFGQDNITIVTQEFHCYRSLFIARYFEMDAVAVSADDGGPVGNMLALREVLARTVAVLDLYVLQRKPKYMGEKIELPI